MNYINKFETTEAYEASKPQLDELEHFIAYDAQTDEIYLKPIPKLYDASIVGNIVLYDNINKQMIHCKPSDYNLTTYQDDQFTPIGVVVIPSSHTNDGKNVIMSIALMSAKNPDVGITSESDYEDLNSNDYQLLFGGYGKELSNSEKYNIPYVGEIPSLENAIFYDEVKYKEIDDTFRGTVPNNFLKDGDVNQDPDNPNNYYFYGADIFNDIYLMPSPYDSNYNKNTKFFNKSNSGGTNIFLDMNGYELTQKYLTLLDNDNWKTSANIDNNGQNLPYLQCCWRFHTNGTKQGEWYAPSIGECCYVSPKLAEINAAYEKLNELNKTFFKLDLSADIDVFIGTSNYINPNFNLLCSPKLTNIATHNKNSMISQNEFSRSGILAFCRIPFFV